MKSTTTRWFIIASPIGIAAFGVVMMAAMVSHSALLSMQDRKWLTRPITVWKIEDVNGTLFGKQPRVIQGAPDGGFVLADRGEMNIRAFSESGKPRWRSGSRGSRPGQFLNVDDLEFSRSGNLLVWDDMGARVTVLDTVGNYLSHFRVDRGETRGGFLPSLSRLTMLSAHPEILRARFRPNGTSDERKEAHLGTTPSSLWVTGHAVGVVNERFAANFPNGAAVIAYRWTSKLVFLRGYPRPPDLIAEDVEAVVDGPEPIPFPEPEEIERMIYGGVGWTDYRYHDVAPAVVEATRSIDAGELRAFVLFSGTTENARRIIDAYSRNGTYQGSYLLPTHVRPWRIAALTDDKVAVLDIMDVPTVWVFKVEVPEVP